VCEGSVTGRLSRWIAGVVVVAVVVLAVGGCADVEAARAFRADAAVLRESLDARAARWQETLDSLPAGDPGRAAVESERARVAGVVAALDAGLARVDEVITEAEKPSDPLTQTVGAVSPLLPISVRGPLLLGAAGVVAGLRAWRLKAGLASVAKGLSVALREDEEFRACFKRHANTFRATQTSTAARVIDEVTGGKPLLALPI
jgi:hypothetical protein